MKNITSFVIFFVITLCIFLAVYQLAFSEKVNVKSYTNEILDHTASDVIFQFTHFSLISSEINNLYNAELEHKFMFKLTFKNEHDIKYSYLHEKNISIIVEKMNSENFRIQQNMKLFQSFFSAHYSHFTIQKEYKYTKFMDDVFVAHGFVKK